MENSLLPCSGSHMCCSTANTTDGPLAPSPSHSPALSRSLSLSPSPACSLTFIYSASCAQHAALNECPNLCRVSAAQNVLRAGLARMGAAYSRISLEDVAKKLGVASADDAESIVAKVIR